MKCHVDCGAGDAFITDTGFDLQIVQQTLDVFKAASRQREVIVVVLSTADDSRFPPSRQSHRLSFVEFRVLKGSESHQTIS